MQVGGPNFKADALSRVGNESGHKLETEVLAPLTRWQDVHMQLLVSALAVGGMQARGVGAVLRRCRLVEDAEDAAGQSSDAPVCRAACPPTLPSNQALELEASCAPT